MRCCLDVGPLYLSFLLRDSGWRMWLIPSVCPIPLFLSVVVLVGDCHQCYFSFLVSVHSLSSSLVRESIQFCTIILKELKLKMIVFILIHHDITFF